MKRIERQSDGSLLLRFGPGEGRIVAQTARRLHKALAGIDENTESVPAWLALKAWNLPGLDPADHHLVRLAILEQKRRQIETFLDRLGEPLNHETEVHLSPGDVEATLGAINDLRLLLADLIGIDEDLHEPPANPHHTGLHQVMMFLTAYQQMILEVGYDLEQQASWSEPPPQEDHDRN